MWTTSAILIILSYSSDRAIRFIDRLYGAQPPPLGRNRRRRRLSDVDATNTSTTLPVGDGCVRDQNATRRWRSRRRRSVTGAAARVGLRGALTARIAADPDRCCAKTKGAARRVGSLSRLTGLAVQPHQAIQCCPLLQCEIATDAVGAIDRVAGRARFCHAFGRGSDGWRVPQSSQRTESCSNPPSGRTFEMRSWAVSASHVGQYRRPFVETSSIGR